ncbi:hypothetical protein DUI87_22828 [Hirundo rustica rustica]|uniref:Tetraspanin-4 n=2 Tax=Passeriformes TaxID=9126 RepID=A0A3M0JH69_HIRRU|nr:hypothetical protein DUI87_22828 [Hirundo rustica rustica]
MLLIIFLLELTVVILFFVYTDKGHILHFSYFQAEQRPHCQRSKAHWSALDFACCSVPSKDDGSSPHSIIYLKKETEELDRSNTIFCTYSRGFLDMIDKYAQRDLKKGLHLYGTDGNIGLTNAWSIIQTDFRCCGVSNYTDWFEVYNTTRVPDSCCLEFSENCGLHSPGTWWKAPCYETVKVWLQENLLAVGIFGLCTAMVQILGLTFAMTMYCQVVKADTYCA